MSKPHLRLVHSSNETQPAALVWQRGRGLRPLVRQKDLVAASSVLEENVWERGLELVHLGLLTSCRNYAAFMQAASAVLDLCTHPEGTRPSDLSSRKRAEGR